MKTVILVNVGTPNSPEPDDVGLYLNEFLMDENIISIPRPFRDILVKLIIVPRRKFASSEKYKKIWTNQGSPLMVHSEKLKNQLQQILGKDWNVVLGMQVGKPSLKEVLKTAEKNNDEIYFCPLYPQYATATTGGALQALAKSTFILKPFYQQDWFIDSVATKIREKLKPGDHLLLSYHGLPISQLQKQNKSCKASSQKSPSSFCVENNCYLAHCLKTSELIQKKLGLEKISVSFQSRLGRAKWIEPSTESVVKDLAQQGIKNLVVACPSFVADCLETLEEIGLELKETFIHAGGQSFELVDCVNDDTNFAKGLAYALTSGR